MRQETEGQQEEESIRQLIIALNQTAVAGKGSRNDFVGHDDVHARV